MTGLALALLAFVGTHFALSHPLRSALVARLGTAGFQALYTLVALATFAWVVSEWRAAPRGDNLWPAGEAAWIAATAVMLAASLLFAGSLAGNPALPQPGAAALARRPVRGMFALTRHPMMWSFALWALAHALVAPYPASLLLTGGMAFLALAGSAGQDAKKRALMGEAWQDWAARTAFVPFAGQLTGRIGWRAVWPGWAVLLAGVAIWLAASWLHAPLGGIVAGVWAWL